MSDPEDPRTPARIPTHADKLGTPQPDAIAGAKTSSKNNITKQTQATTVAQPRSDYFGEDVLKHAKEAFAETIGLKVRQLRRYIPKEKTLTNTELTGDYIEELVRGFIRSWIGEQRLVSGTFYNKASESSTERPMQIDGIVHDCRRGPAVISEGSFEVVHPAFCSGVIEIKTAADLKAMRERLGRISGRYMHHVPAGRVMGVVIASPDPENDSIVPVGAGKSHCIYDYRTAGWCPIFILFKELDGEYLPHFPAIHAMIVAMHELMATTNYLR